MTRRTSRVQRDPMAMKCSTCGASFLVDETPVPPFCSVRCQQVDLGKWLGEEIGVPQESGGVPDEAFRDD
ncbi:MAG: DNA gyrase inhibitor YacG [Planctomycetota bacterium]